jgi:hypothetical protein
VPTNMVASCWPDCRPVLNECAGVFDLTGDEMRELARRTRAPMAGAIEDLPEPSGKLRALKRNYAPCSTPTPPTPKRRLTKLH